MINIFKKTDCCGCTACANICPKHCITMTADEEGFLYPEVSRSLCVNCGLCEKVCPVKFPPILEDSGKNLKLDAFVVRAKQADVLKRSTSGGFINQLNEFVLHGGGVCMWLCIG